MEDILFIANAFQLSVILNPLSLVIIVCLFILAILLILSGLVSGSETAFFSLSPKQIKIIKDIDNKYILRLLYNPNKLLATILISNNFINIGIVILSTFITNEMFDFSQSPTMGFIFQIVVVTFLLLLFGEIIPKIFASQNAIALCKVMAIPLNLLSKVLSPFIYVLTHSTDFIDKKFNKKNNISLTELSQALELTSTDIKEEKEILEGIVNFGNISAEEVMTPRLKILAIEMNTNFDILKQEIIDSGFSRLPVYTKTLDSIRGILYVKDLLPHINKPKNFKWQTLIRPPYFIPESKKIDDLLEDFQEKKSHMAFVVDEYGGCSGIVTMEDVLEEIVGEFIDELDGEDNNFVLDKNGAYIFEADTQLNDFYKITKVDNNVFDDIKGEADSIAGLILEIKEEFPKLMDIVYYRNYKFTVLEIGDRRIKKIKFEILPNEN
ncbi:gliding motility-associated protein GldE [Marinilabiliaceae bacterium JC040]|nr:gliding motility-associated protein GldE [Marinilabiliaceae bacterium JC040]